MTALDLLQRLHELGVTLTPSPDGALHYRAPKGVLTPELTDRMRQHKAELLALVELWGERVAIAQYCGRLAPEAAEMVAWQCMVQGEARATAAAAPAASDSNE